ncbi:extracellular cell wall glucanase Crf1/allergen Asp F9 [Exophiala viscosa]|uniref:chitinase n=1 Tax=Exophiala viscosa TaxID=2486360 RepID=A0AAN6DX27_9EURO|nr:extracellular cell wall glucanase Crf1/allergen Asp F9 [Exophiala viscosa]
MYFSTTAATFALFSLFTVSLAQTFTSCNPMNSTTCPADTALGVANYTIDFTQSMMTDTVWNATAGSVTYGDDGADFTINVRGDAPTVQTNFYIFFGQVEVWLKTAKGQGIVSSIVLESDDLDEVDWEWIGGNDSYVQTNYFGKGNTTSFDRAAWYPVDDPQGGFHNYTVDWTAEKLEWFIDGQSIRVLNYSDANGGKNFPQTPCNVRLGIWAGGDPANANGTIEWAGGETNYNDSPYTMTVKKVRVTDASRGTEYVYGDETGSYTSIKVLNDTTPIKLDGEDSTSAAKTIKQKWNGLPQTTKYIIIGVVGGVLLIVASVFAFCCIRQRRAGKHERLIEDAKYEKNAAEVLAYRADMTKMRFDKSKGPSVHVSPIIGNGGAAFQNYGQTQPMMGGMRSPAPQYGHGHNVNPFGGARGYQKF